MVKWQMHRACPSDQQLDEYAARQSRREASFKAPGSMPDHAKWQPGEWAQWLELEKKLNEQLDAVAKERRPLMTDEVKNIIKDSYKGNASDAVVHICSETMADNCIAFQMYPPEFNQFYDQNTREEMIRNKDSDKGAWMYPVVKPKDEWDSYLQELYLHRLGNAGFEMYWLYEYFPDIYAAAQKYKFSAGVTELIENDTEKLQSAVSLSKELPSWFSPSSYAGFREQVEKHGVGPEVIEPAIKYFGGGTRDKEMRPILESDVKRKALYFLAQGKRYNYLDAIKQMADLQQAIVEAKDIPKLLFTAWQQVEQRTGDKQDRACRNLETLHRSGRQALQMGLA
ncbi:hypothetical protein BJY01DRAFT_246388 [Aspergillus pseudoustus]|uniref:DUF4091 domain-containing protein n=1 Tax=Aspergillus pseudoustus TaxID=1810923 RepID=A0ABR4K7S9_9EURO